MPLLVNGLLPVRLLNSTVHQATTVLAVSRLFALLVRFVLKVHLLLPLLLLVLLEMRLVSSMISHAQLVTPVQPLLPELRLPSVLTLFKALMVPAQPTVMMVTLVLLDLLVHTRLLALMVLITLQELALILAQLVLLEATAIRHNKSLAKLVSIVILQPLQSGINSAQSVLIQPLVPHQLLALSALEVTPAISQVSPLIHLQVETTAIELLRVSGLSLVVLPLNLSVFKVKLPHHMMTHTSVIQTTMTLRKILQAMTVRWLVPWPLCK